MIDDWPASGFVLAELARDPRLKADPTVALEAAFEATFGRAFLVRFTGRLKERLPSMATPALGVSASLVDTGSIGHAAVDNEATGETLVLVHPLARRPGSEHPFVSIGRIDKNDVCLADESVSKFHAYVKESAGAYFLQDARSRNGTTLDGVGVPGRGLGDPSPLRSGQSIRFGGVDVVFLDARATIELMSRMTRG